MNEDQITLKEIEQEFDSEERRLWKLHVEAMARLIQAAAARVLARRLVEAFKEAHRKAQAAATTEAAP